MARVSRVSQGKWKGGRNYVDKRTESINTLYKLQERQAAAVGEGKGSESRLGKAASGGKVPGRLEPVTGLSGSGRG